MLLYSSMNDALWLIVVVSPFSQQMASRMAAQQWMSSAGGGAGEEVFEEEEDPCLICMDELIAQPTTRLQCAHRFHTDVRHSVIVESVKWAKQCLILQVKIQLI